MSKTLRDFDIELRSETVGQHATSCPQCRSTRKKKNATCLSVLIDADGARWNCHHCGWTGGLREGVTSRGGDEHWKPPVWLRPSLADEEHWTPQARKFFEERKIYSEVLARNKIRVARNIWIPQLEDRHDAIAFPFFRLGEIINVKYRGPQKSFRLEKGAQRIFYGLDDIIVGKGTDTLSAREWCVIVEGEMDKLAMEEAGFPNTLSTPNGAPATTTKNLETYFEFIAASNIDLANPDRTLPLGEGGLIDKVGKFYIAVDSDAPGKRLEEELVRRLGPERCWVVRWPRADGNERLKDANDVLKALGPRGIIGAIGEARSQPIEGVFRVEDIDEEINMYYEKGLPPGLSMGFECFATDGGKEICTLELGRIYLVGGIPGHGKSAFVEQVMINSAMTYDWQWAVFAPETQPLELQAANLMEKWAGKPFARGYTTRMGLDDLVDAKHFVGSHFWFLLPDEELFTLDDVLQRFDTLIRRDGVKAVVIDPWNSLRHQRRRDETVDQYLQRTIQQMRNWARIRKVCLIITAHPTKMEKNRRGQDPVPTPYDVKGGSEWFDMMDFCLTVWRNKVDETVPMEIHVQKVKFRHLGALGVAYLEYDKPTGRLFSTKIAAQGVRLKQLNADATSSYAPPPVEQEQGWWMDTD